MNEEQIIWKGTPSQVLNLPAFLLGALAASVITVAALLTAVAVSYTHLTLPTSDLV